MVYHLTFTPSEWKQARTNTIGGSDAAAVLGASPNMTSTELWEIKTGKKQQADISDVSFVKYGIEAEPYLRCLFELDHPKYTVDYEEGNIWYNSDFPFAHASLDGWLTDEDDKEGILEIKTTQILNPIQKQKWENRIPDNYYIQVIHYLMVTGFDFVILKAQIKYDYDDLFITTKHYRIDRKDVEADIKFLAKKERIFYEYIKSGKRPPLALPII